MLLQESSSHLFPYHLRVNIEVGHTDKVGRTQANDFIFFLRGTETNFKMVPIYPVPISRRRTVLQIATGTSVRMSVPTDGLKIVVTEQLPINTNISQAKKDGLKRSGY